MAKKIIRHNKLPSKINNIAGVDEAYFEEFVVGAAVVLDYKTMKLKEKATAILRKDTLHIIFVWFSRDSCFGCNHK